MKGGAARHRVPDQLLGRYAVGRRMPAKADTCFTDITFIVDIALVPETRDVDIFAKDIEEPIRPTLAETGSARLVR